MKPVYNSPFVPVTLWDRGRMKKRWLEGTAAWRHEWFRKRVKIRLGWFLIPAFAFLLILIPTSLAFTISYTTPRTCLGCRSLVFLVYTCAQVPIIAASTWWTYRSDTDPIRTIRGTLRSPTALSVALLLVSAFVAALVLGASLFASFTGTVLQLTGTLSNCVCSIPAASWLSRGRLGELINLASDTAQHRMWSFLWSACGYATVSFMAVMTYLGWWCQMVLRRKLYVEISKLSEGLELGRD
ncbi:hypothetical protein VTK73DRAFT_1737 [Phialemonium thermophilum]|uniref:Uncharacterized protein n=1 Tax=Phialemonium thermophilum TaxID=223376 RepID=A0ABR3VT37_9PEZI